MPYPLDNYAASSPPRLQERNVHDHTCIQAAPAHYGWPLELKNRIMFPPLTTGYEERDGSIGERSLAFTSAWPVAA